LDQAYQIGKVAGMTEEQLSETRKINQSIYTIVKSDADDETVKKELTTILEKITNENSQLEQLSESDKKQMIAQQIEQLSSPWYRSFMKFNPSLYLEKVKCPVLALNGEKDLQVPSKANTEGIKNSLSKGGNKKVTLKVYPNLNHLFQECETGVVEEYGTIEQTFSPTVLTEIKDWILLQTK
jgi:DNA repair exonuclease SbcCD ATPase subunit